MKPAPRLLALFFASTTAWAQEAAPPHVDWEGNPLPAEAMARVGSTRFRPKGPIIALALSPDDKTLACLSQPDSLSFFDAGTGKLLRRFPLPKEPRGGDGLRYEADGRALKVWVCGSYRVIDVETGKDLRKPVTVMGPSGGGYDVSADGKRWAVEDGTYIGIYELESGKKLCKIRYANRGETPSVSFTPDGCFVAVADRFREGVRFHDSTTGKLEFVIPQPDVEGVAISPDGKLLAAPPVLWDLEKRQPIRKMEVGDDSRFYPVLFSPTGKHLYLGSGLTSFVVEVATGKLLPSPRVQSYRERPAFSKNGKTLYNGLVVIEPWNVEAGKPIEPGPEPACRLQGLAANRALAIHGPDLLVAGNTLSVVDWKTGLPRRRFPATSSPEPPRDVLSPDERWIASIHNSAEVRLLETKSAKVKHALVLKDKYAYYLQFTPDSTKLVCFTNEGAIVCWDVATGKQVFRAPDFGKRSFRFVTSPDGRLFATCSSTFEGQDLVIHVWQAGHDRPQRTITMGQSPFTVEGFSLDGKTLLLSAYPGGTSPSSVGLVNFASGKLIKSFISQKDYVQMSALSPDGRSLAAKGALEPLTLWEVASAKMRHQFVGHHWSFGPLLFHPDGSLLAAASSDAPIFIWDVYGKHLNKKPPVEQWSDADSRRYWDTLASDGAIKAFAAVRALVQNPLAALKLLDERLQPVKPVEERRFVDLVKRLGDENFARRKKALAELEQLGEQVEGWLLRETEAKQPLEVQRRLEQIVARLDARSGDSLRGTRALEVLEQIGGAEAERLVARLADGFAAARLTREAKETRERMMAPRQK